MRVSPMFVAVLASSALFAAPALAGEGCSWSRQVSAQAPAPVVEEETVAATKTEMGSETELLLTSEPTTTAAVPATVVTR